MKTHDSVTERLSEYLDDDLEPDARGSIEQHLAVCADCRDTLAELRTVVAHAVTLKDSAPEAELWPAIADRISPHGRSVVPFSKHTERKFSFTLSFTLPQLAAAVLAIVVLSAAMIWMARLGGDRTDFPPLDASVQREATEPVVEITPAKFAEESYDGAIADLQKALSEGRDQLDPETVRVLEANLKAIDHAIEQCRAALASDPGNAYLNNHLADAKKRKLALLRRASALVKEI